MNYMIITSSEMIVYSETDSIFKLEGEVVKKEINNINLEYFNLIFEIFE